MELLITPADPDDDYELTPLQQDWVDRQIAKAPPLTARQRVVLFELLRPVREMDDDDVVMLEGAA